MPLQVVTILTSDSYASARVKYDNLSQETLMELLIADIDNKAYFRTESGDEYLPLRHWGEITLTPAKKSIRSINWETLRLGGAIAFEWIPPTCKYFSLVQCGVGGTIDTSRLQKDLMYFCVNDNHLNGTFDISGLPEGIGQVHISQNLFSGSLELQKLPQEIALLDASNNSFSGTLHLSNLPPELSMLVLSYNKFEGSVNIQNLPSQMGNMFLDHNEITQEELHLGTLPECLRTITLNNNSIARVYTADGKQVDKSHDKIEL